MSETTDQRADLRERIINIVLNRDNGWTFGQITDRILAEMPDPRLSIGGNAPPPEETIEPESDEERLLGIDPENLVRVPPSDLAALFLLHYPSLAEHGVEMLANCQLWQRDHQNPDGTWIDIESEAENAELALVMSKIKSFAGEVEETRERVKHLIRQVAEGIDGWFKHGLHDPIMEIHGIRQTIQGKPRPPGPGTMQYAMTRYSTGEPQREALAREAEKKAEEARELRKTEQARAADLRQQGVSHDEAVRISQAQTDEASEAADALKASSLIGPSMGVQQRTATGISISNSGKWTFAVNDPGGMIDLCLAVGAPALMRESFIQQVAAASLIGQAGAKAVLEAAAKVLMPNGVSVPASFVTTDDKSIRAAITARTSPMRECPGLRVYQEQSARRRGG